MQFSSIFNFIQKKNLYSNEDLQKVKLKIFTLVTIVGYIRVLQIANRYYFEKSITYLFLTLASFALSTFFLFLVIKKTKYLTQIIHVFIIITLLDVINKALLMDEFYITQVQTIFMTTIWAFYGVGKIYGFIYAGLFNSIIFIYIYIYGTNFRLFPQPENPDFYSVWAAYFLYNIIFIWSHNYYREKLQNILSKKKILSDELTRSLQANFKFSETVTKKLKLPLERIVKYSSRLLEHNYSKDKQNKLEILQFSSQSLLDIVNNIILYNSIDNNKNREKQTFSLANLLNNVYDTLRIKTENKHIELNLGYPEILDNILVICDKNRIIQILYNLIGNAIKFTPTYGKIDVNIIEIQKSKNNITLNFSIKDTGIGIEADKIKDIFKPFKQADNSITRKYGGTGLGLAIVEKAIKQLDSSIHVSANTHQGTTFSFDITFQIIQQSTMVEEITSK